MRLMFLGYVVSEEVANKLSGASIAGNRMQLGLIESLLNQPAEILVDLVTVLPIAPGPAESPYCIRREVIDLGISTPSQLFGFLIIP